MPRKEPRDYAAEYAAYHGKPDQVKKRGSRNKAVAKLGRKGAGDGKEVHHKDFNPRNNNRSNLAVVSKKTNRKLGHGK